MNPSVLPENLLQRLAEPFPAAAVSWLGLLLSPDRRQVFVIPYVPAGSYRARLDLIAPGWSSTFEVIDPDEPYLCCQLVLQGVTRTGIGDTIPGDRSFAGKQERAFIRACQAFGLGQYLRQSRGVWLHLVPETLPGTPPATLAGCPPGNLPGIPPTLSASFLPGIPPAKAAPTASRNNAPPDFPREYRTGTSIKPATAGWGGLHPVPPAGAAR
ncbi:MAG TPA: hypothetical protein PKG95_07830 [Anaerolineaceae bacterium]|nr:hypothetical protein [Anaerolineaceae bacterium]